MTATTLTRAKGAPPPPAFRSRPPEWIDRFLGSDPGLTRLRSAAQTVVTIAVAMLAEWSFVRVTHALELDTHGAALPPPEAAAVAAQHHALVVIAIMLGAVVGMIGSFSGPLFPTPRALLVSLALVPVPMIGGLAAGLALAPYRVLALASLIVVLAGGAYCRRFGPLGFIGGMLVFMGDFFGFFLHGAVQPGDIGWLSAEIAIGVLVTIAAQFSLFYPSRRRALRRMQTSFAVRGRRVAAAALALLSEPGDRRARSRRLHRLLVRLNETALMIDAQLGDPAAVPAGWSATALHQRVFDAELALTNTARFAEQIADLSLRSDIREQVAAALRAVVDREPLRAEEIGHALLARLRGQPVAVRGAMDADRDRTAHILVHRFAQSVLGCAAAAQTSPPGSPIPSAAAVDGTAADAGAFAPSAMLFGGWLPGSAMVSAAASLETGPRAMDRIRLAPYSRVAIQMGVAVTGAIVLGDVLSGRRFYWAVIAAFVTFMGANNAGEQLRKGFFRVAGTVVGVLLGAVLAHLVGSRTGLAIAVILASLFFGLYLMRISYAFMVIGITVMVSQLYVQLDEFSNSLLVLRLEETALGAGIAAVTVLCVVPLRTGRVARVAAREYLRAVRSAAELAAQRLLEPELGLDLRPAARTVDAAYQALIATTIPMRSPFTGRADRDRDRYLHGIAASRNYVRNLLTDTDTTTSAWLSVQNRADLGAAVDTLAASVGELVDALQHHDAATRTYTRSAARFDLVVSDLDGGDFTTRPQLALRDFQLLDGALATLAQSSGLAVHALDTAAPIG
jgi:hypothetical protein